MITIPLNTTTGIRIPERRPPEKPKNNRIENIEPISVSIPQAAKLLNVGKPLISRLVKTGKIRAVKLGKRVVVSVQSLHELFGDKEPPNSGKNGNELHGEKE